MTQDAAGKLSFMQLRAEAHATMGHTPLYEVDVNLDLEEMDASVGVTMVFDKERHQARLDPGLAPVNGLAWGNFVDKIGSTGWGELYVTATASDLVSNDVRVYSAGYIEGLLTCVRLSEHYSNVLKLLLVKEGEKQALAAVKQLFANEIGFWKIASHVGVPHEMTEEPEDAYWKHARYVLFQLWGLADGYNFAAKHFHVHTLDLMDLLMLNSLAELPDLMEAYTHQAIKDRVATQTPSVVLLQQNHELRERVRGLIRGQRAPQNTTAEDPLDDAHWEKKIQTNGRCSALVRVSEANADMFCGHTTWGDYSQMLRIFKYYKFPLDGAETMAETVALSSYPGLVSSSDDFYTMSSGLVVMDTSLETMNPFIWDKVQDFPVHAHIPTFAHVMITNRMAKNAIHWTRIFTSAVNTGTYPAQWMVIDYNLFKVGKPVRDNTLWIVEAVPGIAHSEDMSHFLRTHGYWPSFNRPFFDDVREVTGHTSALQSHGSLYSWAGNPRARIFAASAPGANTLFAMRGLMDRNLYPYTGQLPNAPGHEIAARFDLSQVAPIPNGAIDSKVVNRCLMKKMKVQAISGPTHVTQAPFSWSKWPNSPHLGMPDTWNFGFTQMTPTGSTPISDLANC